VGKLVVVVVVVLPDSFRRMGAWRNFTETQQLGHAPRSEVKNGRSSAEDGAPERLGCRTVKEEVSQILQRVSWCPLAGGQVCLCP